VFCFQFQDATDLLCSVRFFLDVDELRRLLETPSSGSECDEQEDQDEKQEGAARHDDGDDSNAETFHLCRWRTSLYSQQSFQAKSIES
jgi:hypothetical protein